MEEPEENMSVEEVKKFDSSSAVKKPKKRSLVERELETSLTARVTSPANTGDGLSTSRYGRARRLKTESELIESQKIILASVKSPGNENTPVKVQSPVYRMHASNSPHKSEMPKKALETYLDNQIDNIYQENISLSRFSDESGSPSPAKKFPKVYIRKDLIQKREEDETIMLIKNLFSPTNSATKSSNSPLSNNLEHSLEKYSSKQNGHVDNSSVVKTLDFDGNKKTKKDNKDKKPFLSKNELFELEAKCPYQVGDLAWARMGTFPFWPCIITRDPYSEMFVKKKLFGRVEHEIIHVTFFGDNGRRSWIVDNMLRNYLGHAEFEDTRDKFTPEDKKKDPRLFAAFFISEKKQALWNNSLLEAETILHAPKRLRIDLFNEMLLKSRASKKNQKSGKITRTNSDVSLSESLYDSLFSEGDVKTDDAERSKNRSRNKSFDVSEVVTACLDNMAAKTGIIKIQKQSHMDRWLQKAKSKTPEKTQVKPAVAPLKVESRDPEKSQAKPPVIRTKLDRSLSTKSNNKVSPSSIPLQRPNKFRKGDKSQSKLTQFTNDKSRNSSNRNNSVIDDSLNDITKSETSISGLGQITKVESLADKVQVINQDTTKIICIDDDISDTVGPPKEVANVESTTKSVPAISELSLNVVEDKYNSTLKEVNGENFDDSVQSTKEPPKNSEISVQTNEDISEPGEAKQGSIMEVNVDTKSLDNLIPVNDENTNVPKASKESMEVDDDKHIESQMNEEKSSLMSETVSNEIMEDNKVQLTDDNCIKTDTGLKEVQNVTIEASVTETKNDDTLTNQADGEQQECIDKQKPFKNTETKVNDTDFLDVSNSLCANMVEARQVKINPKNTSTPEKSKKRNRIVKKIYNSNDILPENTGLEKKFLDTNETKSNHNLTNTSTPEKSVKCDEFDSNIEKLNDMSSERLYLKNQVFNSDERNFSHNSKGLLDQKVDYSKNNLENICIENKLSIDEHVNDEDITMKSTDDDLNESGHSESILQLSNKIDYLENADCHTTLEYAVRASFNESNKSESILESSQTNINAEKCVTEVESTVDDGTKSITITEEYHSSCIRQSVESPTFTQLLESEEFFRDVNETCDSVKNLESESSEKFTEQHEMTNEKANKVPSIGDDKAAAESYEDDEEDETSDDEPSPEYESLDEDITEDFRKHMMSIESNITDKKDEEQIVKICNEIAEKAKLSPIKYTTNLKSSTSKEKNDTSVKDNVDAKSNDKIHKSFQNLTKSKVFDEVDTTTKKEQQINVMDKQQSSDIKVHKIPDKTASTISDNEPLIKQKNKNEEITSLEDPEFVKYAELRKDALMDENPQMTEDEILSYLYKTWIYKENSKSDLHAKEEKQTKHKDKQKSSDIKTRKTPDKTEHCRIHGKKKDLKINGDATMKEITGKTKLIHRTRLSVNSVNKERASPNIIIESSDIKQLRNSCDYDPKVVIIPLERDNTGFFKGAEKITVDEGKSKNKHNLSRLSLKRDSPRNKHTESKTTEHSEPEIKLKESNNFKQESLEKELATLNKAPKKINIENSAIETEIPAPVKVNGYLHDIDRKYTDTPDLLNDTDFDIDAVSVNSEDSEISSSNSVDCLPKRNLRSRPERTLENALKNPEFLKYLELRQDYLMDEHPELNEDEVVSYVYKTWQYEEDLKSDTKKSDDPHHSNVVKGLKQETPSRKKSKKSQPKDNLENHFREKYEKCRKTFDFDSETGIAISHSCEAAIKERVRSKSPVDTVIEYRKLKTEEVTAKRKTRSKSPLLVDLTPESSDDVVLVKDTFNDLDAVSIKSEEKRTPKRTSRSKAITPKSLQKRINDLEDKTSDRKVKQEREFDTESIDSEDSEVPLRQLRSKVLQENKINGHNKEPTLEKKAELTSEIKEPTLEINVKEEADETASTISDNEPLLKQKKKIIDKKSLEDPEFIKYTELRKDALMDENPQLTENEVVSYLYKTWLYEENSKSDLKKNDDLEQANLVKGLNNNEPPPPKKVRRKNKVKQSEDLEVVPKEKPRRRAAQAYYNENFSDIEDELEVFEIFKTKKAPITVVSKAAAEKDKANCNDKSGNELESAEITQITELKTEEVDGSEDIKPEPGVQESVDITEDVEYVDEVELYFQELTKPKPNVFKGLIREKVCDICELAGNLVKCKGCNGMFHADCVKRESEAIEKESSMPLRGRKKKKKILGRKPKSLEDSESQSDEKSQDVSADMSIEDIAPPEICTFDAETFETQLAAKMKELMDIGETNYDSYSSDDGIDWKDTVAGKCEIVDVKLKPKSAPIDYSNFKCNNCQKHDVPVCFVCKSAVSKTDVKMRQKCNVPHCYKYYHLECLDHWPQTQFNSGEPSRNNKKINEFFEALTCPRHVCHTCVSDDPRGCKTRFSGDKLAKCVRCPATYHSFNKCLPAGSQVLTASHIICPRHSDNRTGKVPCHVNTGWCFICALGGSLICCEYCPTSFHAECLNIKPPEGNYMCEDCETGRLPLYGEMVWVKLGHYRWWPGIILHPSEISENIMAVKHGLGEFVVRFFGQYDHYWVNRGRVFPYQEGDSGRVSGQKSKIDAAFTTAIEHAQRAYAILKNAEPNEEESLDIASSLLPPHYVKLKCNKPCGSLCGRKVEDPSLSLTQCECNPDEPDPCGPYSQCLNRMLLTECGPTCRAGERCNNRAFEKRLYPKLVPYRTPHRGWGLKTLEDIKAGQFVIEYVGELIDEEEFRRRMRRKHEIRDENFYFLTLDKERMIDAGPKGNSARFMNHCCEPNCETQKWTVLGDVRVGLFAIDDIPANSEVTFNYNLECAGIEKKRCLCGAKRCSGYIGAKPKQDESQSKKSKDSKLAAKRTYKKKKIDESSTTTKNKQKKPVGRPPKPKELTEIEKDLLIIKNATSVTSSDESSRSQSIEEKNPKMLKRKRVSISTDEVSLCNGLEPSVKKQKCEEKPSEVGD